MRTNSDSLTVGFGIFLLFRLLSDLTVNSLPKHRVSKSYDLRLTARLGFVDLHNAKSIAEKLSRTIAVA